MKHGSSFHAGALLAKLSEGRTPTTFQNDQAIYAQGEGTKSAFCVISGLIKISILSPQGREGVIALLRRGDFLGEECLTGHPTYLSSATALGECMVLEVSTDVLLDGLKADPNFVKILVNYLVERKLQAEEFLGDQLFYSSEKRLARCLILLANVQEVEKASITIPKLSHEMLADMVGTTRSRVTFFMNKFRQEGWIHYDGQLTINRSLFTAFP